MKDAQRGTYYTPTMRLGARACALLLVALGAVSAQVPARVDRAQLMRDVATLAAPAMEGRRAGSPGGLKAREWIAGQFKAAGLAPAGTAGYLQPFTTRDRIVTVAAANVIGRIAGTDPRAKIIVITAHYDHLGVRNGAVYHGADDNASGVAALLAAARHFAGNRPRHSLLFAALDAEEIGHRGAAALLGANLVSPADIALNVNLDMVSRSDANEIYAAGTSYSPWLKPFVEEVGQRAAVMILFGHDRPNPADRRDDWTHLSDHSEFHKAGLPFIYFGVEDHADYHQPTDTADRIEPRFFGDAADMIVDALRTFDARLP
jgi:Zn-dependent M28 family amino/carboxypeptidase